MGFRYDMFTADREMGSTRSARATLLLHPSSVNELDTRRWALAAWL